MPPTRAAGWGGTPDVAPFILSTAGIEAIAAIGVERMPRIIALQTILRAALEPRTPQWRWPKGDIGGTLCIDTGTDQPRVAAALTTNAISADFRGTTVRLSFHAYNGADDLEQPFARSSDPRAPVAGPNQGCASSSCAASWSSSASSPERPTNCVPIGNPSGVRHRGR